MRYRLCASLLALFFLSAPWTLGDEKESDKKEDSIATQFSALRAELSKSQQATIKKLQSAKDEKERNKLIGEYFAAARSYAGRFLALAKKDPKNEEALDPLMYLLTSLGTSSEADAAADLIVEHHLGSKRILESIGSLARSQSFGAEKILLALATKSQNKEIKGRATYALATYLSSRAELVEQFKSIKGEQLEAIKGRVGEAFLKRFQAAKPDKLKKRAETLLEQVVADYSDVEDRSGRKLGEQAETELFAMKNLAVGKEAPDIEAEDIDGEKFKLSDYRGKVVLLDFWGNW